jgi:hypothetical protein
MSRTLLPLLTAATLLATGCLKRIESIVIAPDGSAKLFIYYSGDREDVLNGDAMPSEDTGWQIVDKVKASGKSGEEHSENIERAGLHQVRPGEAFPSSYARPGSPLEPVALRFPTTLTIEERDDGTYYHFRRAYCARRAARIDFLHRDILEDEDLQKITNKDPEELTEANRRTLAEAFIRFEAGKTLTFIDQAAAALGDEVAPDAWLPMRPQVEDVYGDADLLNKAIVLMQQEDMEQHLALLEERVLDDVVKTISRTLRGTKVPEAVIARFVEAYDRARRDYEITEDLADEEFHVNIQMPGRIIAHNCNRDDLPPTRVSEMSVSVKVPPFDPPASDAEAPEAGKPESSVSELGLELDEDLFRKNSDGKHLAGPNRCGWRFEGSELRDHDMVLLAISFVPKEK